MLKVLLVDDHAVVRNGIKQIITDAFDLVEIGEAADELEALQLVAAQYWDLVMLDIRLPGRSGVDVLKKIKSEKPKLPVLILSTYPESQYAVRLIHAGAAGYLSKDAEESDIVKAIQLASKGSRYISSTVGELLANHINNNVSDDEDTQHTMLSDREFQIFLELAAGARTTDIADKLRVSSKTVTTHRSRILQKMGLKNNAELTLYASRTGLI